MSCQPNLLFLAHRAPHPPDRGDRIRSLHLLQHLAATHRVYLGALLDEPLSDSSRSEIEKLTFEQALAPVGRSSRWSRAAWSLARGRSATEGLFSSPALRAQVRRWATAVKFDAVYAYCSSMIQYADVSELAQTPLIVDLVDVDSRKWLDYAAAARGWKRFLFSLEAQRVSRLERSLPARAKAIALVSEAEADLYRSLCPNDKTVAITNGVDLDYFSDQFVIDRPRPHQCVFVGVLDYRANVESLVWFCREVWPRVVAAKPDAQFAIVGKNPTAAVGALAQQPGVRLIGPVPDVRPYIAESRFVVAPLLVARGIQNKVLEAMSMGKPVVATPPAVEGLSVQSGVHLIAADTAADQCDAMLRIYRDNELANRLSVRAREYAARNHGWPACLERLGAILESISSHTATRRETPRTVACSLV